VTQVGRFQHYSSGGLALLVHGLFFAALVFGISWKNPPQLPAQADLWASLPELPAPPPEPEPLPPPVVEPLPPPPVVEAKPSQADIALEKAEKKKREALQRLEEKRLEEKRLEEKRLEEKRLEEKRREEARQAELQRQTELKRQSEEKAKLEKERAEKEKRDQARRQVEQELARQMQDELDTEAAQLRAFQERAKAGRQARVVKDFEHRIQAKIQSYMRLPQKLVGNPEAVFQVSLLPNGEVSRITLVKSSGQPVYDAEVERAILKASPLPLPVEKGVATLFREGLNLKFRPFENGAGGT
jgi:colicin import membrane protein